MDAKQHLYYALGILAYGVAKADGTIQREEKEMVKKIVEEETDHAMDYGYTEIIFLLLEREKKGFQSTYDWAMKNFELGKHHFTDEMKKDFVTAITKVAEAFPPNTDEEMAIIQKFKEDLDGLKVNAVIE